MNLSIAPFVSLILPFLPFQFNGFYTQYGSPSYVVHFSPPQAVPNVAEGCKIFVGVLKELAKASGTTEISAQTVRNKISKGKKKDDKK